MRPRLTVLAEPQCSVSRAVAHALYSLVKGRILTLIYRNYNTLPSTKNAVVITLDDDCRTGVDEGIVHPHSCF